MRPRGEVEKKEEAEAIKEKLAKVGGVVTLGFVAVFTTIGALIAHLSLAVEKWFPWMTIAVGIGVLALGHCPLKTEKLGMGQRDVPIAFGGVCIAPGDYIYADNNGVIVSKRPLL